MKAVRGTAPGVRVVDIDEPWGDGELIRVHAVGICASDLSYLRRGSTQVVGHEIAGVTEDGTPVAVEAVFGCGGCRWCAEGRFNLCRAAGADILGLTVSGGMSEYFRVPRTSLVPLPDGLRTEDACFAEPGAVAWHAVANCEFDPGSRVAVVGAGAIGLLAVLAALEQGASEVSLEARHAHQIEAGERLGATSPGGEYDAVIEASGSENGLARAVELARPRGTVATISVYPSTVAWPYRDAFLKEVRTVPSIAYDRYGGESQVGKVARMLAVRPEVAGMLITHRFGIDDAEQAFAVAAERAAGAVRVVVHP